MPFSVDEHGQPAPIDYEREGFDGPPPGNVAAFPAKPLFRVPIAEDKVEPAGPRYTEVINAALDVLSARLLALIATGGAVAMFAAAVYSPGMWRTATAVAYAVVVLCPTIFLALRKG